MRGPVQQIFGLTAQSSPATRTREPRCRREERAQKEIERIYLLGEAKELWAQNVMELCLESFAAERWNDKVFTSI